MTVQTSPETNNGSEQLGQKILDLLTVESDEVFASRSLDFIADRVAQLEASSEARSIGQFVPHHKGFIHSTSEISSQALMPGFHVDDPEIFETALASMRELYEMPSWQSPDNYRKMIFFGVQFALDKYFGNTFPSAEQQAERTEKIWSSDIVSDDLPPPLTSIADYKNIALCTERAAAANNMLCLLGIEPEFVIGELQVNDKRPEGHAFLIITNPQGEKLIFDPTHPQLVQKGEQHTIKPFIVKGGDAFLNGETAEVVHMDKIRDEEVVRQYKYMPSPIAQLVS